MSRLALLAGLLLTLALVPSAMGGSASAPSGLRAFVLRADEPVPRSHTYAQMPAFAWNVKPGATKYQLQLADNRSFSDISILHQDLSLHAPVDSIQMQLPWMNGNPYALWVRVRAIVASKPTEWSRSFGFNMGWQNVPQQLPAANGLIRWTPVDGATSYQVWFTNINRSFVTFTNVADEREYWTLHPGLGSIVKWRVRAVRTTQTTALPSGIQITPYGPWSDPFTTLTTGKIGTGKLHGGVSMSDVEHGPQALMPGFAWSGSDGIGPLAAGNALWRVYVFSDRNCINPVMTGALTGGPAWAPRAVPSLVLPSTSSELMGDVEGGTILKYGSTEGATYTADISPVLASEDQTSTSASGSGAPASTTPASTTPATSPSTASSGATSVTTAQPGQVELPDSGWPTGRYWWTVVPVDIFQVPAAASSSTSSSGTSGGKRLTHLFDTSTGSGSPSPPSGSSGSTTTTTTTATSSAAIEYHDAEVAQDACRAGRVWSFGLQSAPVTTAAAATPYASGLTAGPRLVAAANRVPKFTALPLVTWKPALGAQSYEIQLSQRIYPWTPVVKQTSVVPSAVLQLTAKRVGTWFYRVRGVNSYLPSKGKMTWSTPVEIRITGNQFKVLG